MAKKAMKEIRAAGKIPVIAGGTGFYIQALLKDVEFPEDSGESPMRRELIMQARSEGAGSLHRKLAEIDPESAKSIHPNNVRRVIRALEFCMGTGRLFSQYNEEQGSKESPYCCAYFVLTDDRKTLYERIDRRVDEMMENGLLEEVARLRDRGLTEENSSMKALGYKEFFPYFRGEISLEEAVRVIKRDTRHFAKRQLTWFRREPDVIWIDRRDFAGDENRMLEYMLNIWHQKLEEENPALCIITENWAFPMMLFFSGKKSLSICVSVLKQ